MSGAIDEAVGRNSSAKWFDSDWNDDSFLTGMEDPTMEIFEPLYEPLEEVTIILERYSWKP